MSGRSKKDYPPGFWRRASSSLSFVGVPAWLFLLYLFWFRFPCMETIYIVTGVIAVFRLLSMFGWGVTEMLTRLARLARGKSLSGRPWWYRRFNDGE
ncbi:conjugal transfer protein [Enterobacter hormaechei]|nr:conjugal transfer protein [Enterobacter hormaechei]ELD3190772.1 conjugal transfer protein [Enterobacter hormaechei]